MSEFVSKKLGEVLAFSRVGLELVERGGDAAVEALGGDKNTEEFKAELNRFAESLEAEADEVTAAKADKTVNKLVGMMEAYIGDDWDNPVELLEWLSFFCGAGAAHWALVEGATGDELATEAQEHYHDVLHHVVHSLKQIGSDRASE